MSKHTDPITVSLDAAVNHTLAEVDAVKTRHHRDVCDLIKVIRALSEFIPHRNSVLPHQYPRIKAVVDQMVATLDRVESETLRLFAESD
jgi:hypothetical protein